jgi:hypothetical protein
LDALSIIPDAFGIEVDVPSTMLEPIGTMLTAFSIVPSASTCELDARSTMPNAFGIEVDR